MRRYTLVIGFGLTVLGLSLSAGGRGDRGGPPAQARLSAPHAHPARPVLPQDAEPPGPLAPEVGGGELESGVVDRIVDGTFAVVLIGPDEQELILPLADLPPHVAEGDWLLIEWDGESIRHVQIDAEKTAQVKERIRSKLDRLRERGQ